METDPMEREQEQGKGKQLFLQLFLPQLRLQHPKQKGTRHHQQKVQPSQQPALQQGKKQTEITRQDFKKKHRKELQAELQPVHIQEIQHKHRQ